MSALDLSVGNYYGICRILRRRTLKHFEIGGKKSVCAVRILYRIGCSCILSGDLYGVGKNLFNINAADIRKAALYFGSRLLLIQQHEIHRAAYAGGVYYLLLWLFRERISDRVNFIIHKI